MRMDKPKIGITTTSEEVVRNDGKKFAVQTILEMVRQAIIKAEGIPIVLPPSIDTNYFYDETIPKLTDDDKDMLISNLEICDGLVIPGGIRFFEHDLFMARWALNHDMPLLGICRGMQVMVAADNIKYDDYKGILQKIKTGVDHSNDIHNIRVLDDTELSKIMKGRRFAVNSQHKMMVTKVHDATISAYSADGIIEAIEFPDNLFAVGTQWHPEKMMDNQPNKVIIDSFIDASKKDNLNKVEILYFF